MRHCYLNASSVTGLMTVRRVENLLVCFGRYIGMKILREKMR